MAESLGFSPETVTTFLIGYTPIQNKKFFLKRKEKKRPLWFANLTKLG